MGGGLKKRSKRLGPDVNYSIKWKKQRGFKGGNNIMRKKTYTQVLSIRGPVGKFLHPVERKNLFRLGGMGGNSK